MLLRRIETFLLEQNLAPSRFGRLAGGDPRLVFDLRKGRTLRPETEVRLMRWMSDYEEAVDYAVVVPAHRPWASQ